MDRIINLNLMAQPLNWLIVWTVLGFAGFAWVLVHEGASSSVPTAQT